MSVRNMRHVVSLLVGLAIVSGVLSNSSFGSPASPFPFEVTQPDGAKVKLRLIGGPRFHALQDLNGFTVQQTPDGYVYANRDEKGQLVPTKFLVGKVNPQDANIPKGLLPSEQAMFDIRARTLPL